MRRDFMVFISLTTASILLSACGTTTATTPVVSPSVQQVGSGNVQPQKQADLQGTVKTITGNQFTLETVDMSSDPLFQEMQTEDFRTKMQLMTDAERQAIMQKMQTARENAKKTIVEVTIPVGVPIMIRTVGLGGFGGAGGMMRGGAGGSSTNSSVGSSLGSSQNKDAATPPVNTPKEGTITDIKVGSTVSIWLNPDIADRKIASWVSVSSAQSTSGANPRP